MNSTKKIMAMLILSMVTGQLFSKGGPSVPTNSGPSVAKVAAIATEKQSSSPTETILTILNEAPTSGNYMQCLLFTGYPNDIGTSIAAAENINPTVLIFTDSLGNTYKASLPGMTEKGGPVYFALTLPENATITQASLTFDDSNPSYPNSEGTNTAPEWVSPGGTETSSSLSGTPTSLVIQSSQVSLTPSLNCTIDLYGYSAGTAVDSSVDSSTYCTSADSGLALTVISN